MADIISPELFDKLVELAALELDPAEAEYLRRQLNNQLKAVAELERIPVPDDIPPAAHGVTFGRGLRPAWRADEPARTVDPAAILAQAPFADDGYFVVPEIPHTQLSQRAE